MRLGRNAGTRSLTGTWSGKSGEALAAIPTLTFSEEATPTGSLNSYAIEDGVLSSSP
jgi:hypothetical protein